MNALKYIAVAVAVLALGSAVADEDNYIYWMVENAHYYEEPGYGIPFAYATISVDDGATYLSPAALPTKRASLRLAASFPVRSTVPMRKRSSSSFGPLAAMSASAGCVIRPPR